MPGIGIEEYISQPQLTMMVIVILSVLSALNPVMYNLSAWVGLKVSHYEYTPIHYTVILLFQLQ